MKTTDKITLTVGQIKRLIKESIVDDDIIKTVVKDALKHVDYDVRHHNTETKRFRYKFFDTNRIGENTIEVFWLTQEGFHNSFKGDEFDRFANLLQKQIKLSANTYDYEGEIIVKLTVQCRDGKWAGYGQKTLNIEC